jgi:prevent-host-death family protein
MASKALSLSDVRKHFPTLVDEVAHDKKTVVIMRHGKPVAQLSPYVEPALLTATYPLRNVPIEVSDDFDAPLANAWDALH